MWINERESVIDQIFNLEPPWKEKENIESKNITSILCLQEDPLISECMNTERELIYCFIAWKVSGPVYKVSIFIDSNNTEMCLSRCASTQSPCSF